MSNIAEKLKTIVGEGNILTEQDEVITYSKDYTYDSLPLVSPHPCEGCIVAKVKSVEEIAEIMKYANQEKISVVPRGAGTGVVAAAISQKPGIIIALEKMNKIIEVDDDNLMITCECGVPLHEIITRMNEHPTLYFPMHPGDEGAHVGGMVSTNAGGVNAVKYGVMRDQVKGMEVVLPTGEIIQLGGNMGKLMKNNAGYDLMNLIIGSEGTLGIVTKATMKLYPKPKASGTLIISFANRREALSAVPKILEKGIIPVALEYVEKHQIRKTAQDLGKTWPAKQGNADLIVILAEDSVDNLHNKSIEIEDICSEFEMLDAIITDSPSKQRDILEIRSHIYPSIEKEVADLLDTTVPRSKIVDFIDEIDRLSEYYQTEIPVLSHAGDGNVHVFPLKQEGILPEYHEEMITKIYQKTIELGGTITGEHGIGSLRVNKLSMQFSGKELELMRNIKSVFDPNDILNPGKKIV